jgi:hypothetical protein
MSTKLPISKVTSMVRCLCRSHNFCIDERLLREGIHFNVEQSPAGEQADEELADHLDSDHVNIVLGGGASVVERFSPEALLHDGGEHFDDVSRTVRVSRKATGT